MMLLQEQRSELERLTSENKLFNIRLSSISEILSIQEVELAKVTYIRTECLMYVPLSIK